DRGHAALHRNHQARGQPGSLAALHLSGELTNRETARSVLIWAAAAIFAAALVRVYHARGGPYFQFPKTVQDHVAPTFYPSRDMILLSQAATDIVPRGATVTAIRPAEAPDYDITLYLTAGGMMPRHRVVPPTLVAAERPQFGLAVRGGLSDPHYRRFRQLREGRIYRAVTRSAGSPAT